MAFNAVALLPEVGIEVPNVNDDAEHVLFIQQADDALDGGQDPLDFKKLVTDMRFDEVSAKYAEFGDFYVGKIIPA